MALSTGEQDVVCKRRERYLEYLLREGFSFQNDFLVDPVPDSEGVIGGSSETCEHVTCLRELDMSVSKLGSLPANTVQFEARVLVDINVWELSFLSDGKVLLAGVHCD